MTNSPVVVYCHVSLVCDQQDSKSEEFQRQLPAIPALFDELRRRDPEVHNAR